MTNIADKDWTEARERLWKEAEARGDAVSAYIGGEGWCMYGHQSKLNERTFTAHGRTLRFERTCEVNPEQYDVFQGTDNIGYVRLRRGRLTADFHPVFNDDEVFVEVLRQYFNDEHVPSDRGNFWVGSFGSEAQRMEWLMKIAELLAGKLDEYGYS